MMVALLSLMVVAQVEPDGGAEVIVDAGVVSPVEAGSVDALSWTPIIDAFGEFQARFPRDAAPFNAFTVPRVQVGVQADWKGASGRVLLEGVYATQGGALIGVAGDSVVVRLREAWGGYRWKFLEAQLGLVPTLVVPEVERRRALLLQGFARAELFGRLLLAARVHLFNRDLTQEDQVLEIVGGVGVKAEPVELFLAVHRTSLSGAARTSLPGVDSTDVRVVVRVRWPPVSP
jgi:hypothetical protein